MEDYKKKYEQALERAKEQSSKYGIDKVILEEVFPELKESKDEKIRKQLLNWFKCCNWNAIDNETLKRDDIIAWLEKQGENQSVEGTFVNVDDVRDDFMSKVYRVLNEDTTNDRANQIIQAFDSMPTVTIKKPQDKPILEKFEVGDWVVPNNGEPKVFRVEERGWPDSVISSSLGNQYVNTFTLDKQYHHWTIKDAKDGDVLVTKDRPFLFKGFADECSEHPVAYCGIDTTNAFYIPTSNSHWTYNICLLATKEQRDLLFTKMKEAGYEWDAEKKKLKKIEQKSDENIEPKFKIGDTIVEKDLGECGCGTIVNIKDGKYIFDDGCFIWIKGQERWQLVGQKPTWDEKIKGLTKLETYILSLVPDRPLDAIKVDTKNIRYIINKEQNPAWSEEDENMLKSIIATCELAEQDRDSSPARHLFEMQTNWLKSLKERVQPQPKQEWIEEDENMLKHTIDTVEFHLNHLGSDLKGRSLIKEEINWLKSLKERMKGE